MDEFLIYTDGAYSRKNNEGAFAYIILDANGVVVKQAAHKIVNETNNRAELKAIIAAIYNLPNKGQKVKAHVISDSQYALNTLFAGWSRNTNHDLFDAFERIILERDLDIEWSWVKGHSGDFYNELCDDLCCKALGYDPSAEYARHKKNKNLF